MAERPVLPPVRHPPNKENSDMYDMNTTWYSCEILDAFVTSFVIWVIIKFE
mgnify:CR=1 FL=1